jgi:hypothetical protein
MLHNSLSEFLYLMPFGLYEKSQEIHLLFAQGLSAFDKDRGNG